MDLTNTVIIVNFKTPGLTVDCIKSLQSSGALNPSQISLIDNHSMDHSVSEIEAHISAMELHNSVSLHESPINGGFSAGNNIGIKKASSKYVLLLNSDTLVRPGAIELLVKTLEDNPEIGMASPRLKQLSCGLSVGRCLRI